MKRTDIAGDGTVHEQWTEGGMMTTDTDTGAADHAAAIHRLCETVLANDDPHADLAPRLVIRAIRHHTDALRQERDRAVARIGRLLMAVWLLRDLVESAQDTAPDAVCGSPVYPPAVEALRLLGIHGDVPRHFCNRYQSGDLDAATDRPADGGEDHDG